MATLTFDTHEFVRKLKSVGFSEEQAEVITDLQKTTVANTLEQAKDVLECKPSVASGLRRTLASLSLPQ
jgi:hypothetical protein